MHRPGLFSRASRRACASVLGAAVLVAGCSASSASSRPLASGSSAPTTLRIATSFTINNLDPLENGFWGSEFGFGDLLMKPVGDDRLAPWLLQTLTQSSPDVWSLTLRPGITFQDGHRLDATALAQTMNWMLANNTSLEPVLPKAVVAPTGPLTVTLTTAQPSAAVPSLLANEAMFDIFDAPVYLRLRSTPDALVRAKIYTGPYTVTSLDSRQMVMMPTPGYYGPAPKLTRVAVLFVADAQARIDAVEHGEADIALYPPTAAARQLEGRTDAYFASQRPGVAYEGFRLFLNLRSAPFDDVMVRRALLHAIDYAQLSQEVLGGYYDTATGLYPGFLPYARHDQTTDTVMAAHLLDSDGWTRTGAIRSKGGRQLSFTVLTYPQQPDVAPIALALQSQLRTLGVDVRIRQVDDIDAEVKQPSGWSAAIDGDSELDWTGTDPVQPLVDDFTTHGQNNNGGIVDPRIDRIVSQLEAGGTTTERTALLEQAQQIIVEQEAYSAYLAVKRDPVVVSPRFRSYAVPLAALLWMDAYA